MVVLWGGAVSYERGNPLRPVPDRPILLSGYILRKKMRSSKSVLCSPKAPHSAHYRGTSLIRNDPPLAPYSRTMPRALRWS